MEKDPISSYIDENSDFKEKLTKLDQFIMDKIPQGQRTISYGMPTIKVKGKNIIHFAAAKSHIGIYPASAAIEKFKDELKEYSLSKGTIRVKDDQEIPWKVIEKIIKFNLNKYVK